MPVLNPERGTAGRSALRFRPINPDQAAAGPVVSRVRRSRPDARVTTAPIAPDHLELEEERVPRRSRALVPRQPVAAARTERRAHPLLFVGLGLVVTILLWTGISQAVNWCTSKYNDIVYGNPRTFQADAIVGHGDNAQHPSHFIALNLRGTISIIEFPAGDPSRARVLATTTVPGPNADLAVVTLQFIDINHNGHPDMLINIDGMESVLINEGQAFRLPTAAEQQQILSVVQQQQ